jgi:hypothetical protein
MDFWSGVTDNNWYTFLAKHGLDEVNLPAGRQASGGHRRGRRGAPGSEATRLPKATGISALRWVFR